MVVINLHCPCKAFLDLRQNSSGHMETIQLYLKISKVIVYAFNVQFLFVVCVSALSFFFDTLGGLFFVILAFLGSFVDIFSSAD